MVKIQPVNTTYEPFSLEPEYVEANRGFLRRQSLRDVKRFLDLACGTGTVAELLLESVPAAHLHGIDLDPVQIKLSSKRFHELGYEIREGCELTTETSGGKPVLTFAAGSADALPFPEQAFDCVTIANAIHLLPDKEKFLNEVCRVLEPGGLFGFNTTFYAGAIPAGTNKIYLEWLRLATQHIDQKNDRLREAGKTPIKRVRGSRPGAFQNRWLSPQQWSDQLASCGLRVHDIHERLVEVDERGFALVGAYGGLAEVLMSGYPVAEASEALQASAKPAMQAANVSAVARNYLEIWATRG